ncbi:EamA family transporter [Paraburkholderia sp.]|uniref:EamA family transporter n=1 Tax=Paraburkholderia sp. TaxID=1926495 RepID=UPI002D5D4BCB|nr:EamA family transporter [Paraburkholderia sp.]HZZ05236.1 EamA family transporter [Paraburkholderia sp.]
MRTRLLAAFGAIYLLWGSTYLAVSVGLRSFPPLALMGVRCLAGGVILLAWGLLRGQSFPPLKLLWAGVGCGLLFFVGCHGVLAMAQQHVPSSTAAIILATIPFWIAISRFLLPGERRPPVSTILALGAGFIGVGIIAWPAPSSNIHQAAPGWIVALLAASISWALGTNLSQRRKGNTSAITLAGVELLAGGLVLATLCVSTHELDDFRMEAISLQSLGALAYLTVAGTVIAFAAYIWLLEQVDPTLIATYTFVNPVIAVVLGWVFLNEQLTTRMFAGAPLIIGAVCAAWMIDRKRAAPHHQGI